MTRRTRRRRTRQEEAEEEEEQEEEATDIKSNNPHLAGGEKNTLSLVLSAHPEKDHLN